MAPRRRRSDAAPLFAVAAGAYAANVALGSAVAARLIDTSSFRWLHHAIYIATCVASAAAFSSIFWGTPTHASRRAALAIAPAAAPLAAIPYLGTHSRRHPIVALAAAPFIVAGLICSHLSTDRK